MESCFLKSNSVEITESYRVSHKPATMISCWQDKQEYTTNKLQTTNNKIESNITMGNEISTEAEQSEQTLGNLDSPDVDMQINEGTTAPAYQPKHTLEEVEKERKRVQQRQAMAGHGEGVEVVKSENSRGPEFHLPDDGNRAPLSKGFRRIPSTAQVQDAATGNAKANDPQIDDMTQQQRLSYLQMAKVGYQELVNAFIRPPRAEYKVCLL